MTLISNPLTENLPMGILKSYRSLRRAAKSYILGAIVFLLIAGFFASISSVVKGEFLYLALAWVMGVLAAICMIRSLQHFNQSTSLLVQYIAHREAKKD